MSKSRLLYLLLPVILISLTLPITACDSSRADRVQQGVGSNPTGPGTGTTVTPPASNNGTGTSTTNSAPVALPDVAVVQLNSSGNAIGVLGNDVDANGDALKITAASLALSLPPSTGGTIAIAADGSSLRYTPPQGFVGTQTLNYTISDGRGGAASSTVVITVSPLAVPPVALPDAFTVRTDAAPAELDVLANDLDNAGGGLTLVSASSVTTVAPGNAGTVSIANNRLRYQPRPGFAGVETLLYTLRDANGATTSASVVITVLPLAAPPVALPDVATLAAGTGVDLDVLANDVDLAGGGLTLVSVAVTASVPPANGGFSVVNNRVRYTPPSAGFAGTQTATYTLRDVNGMTATGLITLVITPAVPPLPPVAVPDVATLAGGTTTASLDVLANDLDPTGGGLTLSGVTVAASVPPAAAITAEIADAKVKLTLPAGYTGIVTLSYDVKDANGSSATAAVVVTVQPAALPPAPPVTVPDALTVQQDSAAVLVDVVANDVDPAGGGLTLTAASVTVSLPPGTHQVSVSGNQLRFAPAAGFVGAVTVGYTVMDINGSSVATGVLSVVVTAAPPVLPPVAVADTATVSASAGPASIGVLANDVDTNGGGLTLTAVTLTAAAPMGAGSLAIADNAVRYTPTALYTGLVTVGYTVTDSQGGTAMGTLVITVVP